MVMSGMERVREMCRRNAAESNLDDDIGDIEPSKEELGSDEEDGASALDYSTSGPSSRSSSDYLFHSTIMSCVSSSSSFYPFVIPSIPDFTLPPTHTSRPPPPLMRGAEVTSLTADMYALAKLVDGQRDLVHCGDEFERLEW